MRLNTNHSKGRSGLRLLPILALMTIALASAMVGTLAWMRYQRSLQTMTKVEIPILSIEGSAGGVLAMNLGDIDVTSGTQREYVFGIRSNQDTQYKLQLAHTTNIPFTYTIYPATKGDNRPEGAYVFESGKYFSYEKALAGNYLNKNGQIATDDYHQQTYGNYNRTYIQERAEPLYWQSQVFREIQKSDVQYYVLVVSWTDLENDKETDMVYLTAFTGGA